MPSPSQLFEPDKIIIHHSACPDGPGNNTAEIRLYHLGLGYRDIGYHILIEDVGGHFEALHGRDWDLYGAHTLGQNNKALGICFVGNFELAAPAPGQLIVGAKPIAYWCRVFGIPASEIYPHSQFNATACPGKLFPMYRLRELVEAAI